MTLKIVLDKTKEFFSSIKELNNKRVFVGIPSEDSGRNDGAINNATLAYIMTNGSPARRITPRPYIQPAIEEKKKEIDKLFVNIVKKSLDKNSNIDKELNIIGLSVVSYIKSYIKNSSNFVELSESTIKSRQRKGFSGTKPLIRTGQLLNSTNYVIRKK